MRNLNVPHQFGEAKDALLSMLEESDHMDYSVTHTPDRSGVTIIFGADLKSPKFRVTLSAVENAVAIRVSDGLALERREPNRYIQKDGLQSELDSVLAWLTELVETADNEHRNFTAERRRG